MQIVSRETSFGVIGGRPGLPVRSNVGEVDGHFRRKTKWITTIRIKDSGKVVDTRSIFDLIVLGLMPVDSDLFEDDILPKVNNMPV